MDINIVAKNKCATDRSKNLLGACQNCYNLYKKGHVIKIKDTLDKDNYSCGCMCRPEYYKTCDKHNEQDLFAFK